MEGEVSDGIVVEFSKHKVGDITEEVEDEMRR